MCAIHCCGKSPAYRIATVSQLLSGLVVRMMSAQYYEDLSCDCELVMNIGGLLLIFKPKGQGSIYTGHKSMLSTQYLKNCWLD